MREEYIMPALGIRNRHLHPVMHQISEWMPTLPVIKKADNTLHPHLEQERPYPYIYPTTTRPAVATHKEFSELCHVQRSEWSPYACIAYLTGEQDRLAKL